MQHYIKAIYELSTECDGVRISDIAAKVGVTKASACIATKTLQQKSMVYRDTFKLVFLTKECEHQAILALDKAKIIRRFLTDVLGIKHEVADADACAMEHITSIDTLCSICRYINRQCMERCCAKLDTSMGKNLSGNKKINLDT